MKTREEVVEMSFGKKLGAAVDRAKTEKAASQDEGPEPKTAGDLEEEAKVPAGWTLAETWEKAWPLLKPMVAYAGVLGYTAVWWAVQASVWITIAHAAAAALALCWSSLTARVATWAGTDRRRVLIGGTTAAVWLVTALSAPWSWTVIVAGWVVMLALSARYYQNIRPGYPDDPPAEVVDQPVELPEAELPEVDPGGMREEWTTYVATSKLIPDSTLTYLQTAQYTYDYTLQLSRKQPHVTAKMVPGKLAEISHALGISAHKLMIEPDLSEDGDPTRLDFKLLHTNPVAGVNPYTGPRFEDGIAYLGRYVDGQGEAGIRIYQDGGLWSCFLAGDTGTGKGRVTETIGVAAVSDPLNYPTILLYTDPQMGASSEGLKRGAARYSDLTDLWPLVTAVTAIGELRQAELAQNGGSNGFECKPCTCGETAAARIHAMVHCQHRPGCPYKPGIYWIIDECHGALADPAIKAALERIAREFRKLGIGLLLASQYGTLDAAFAGSAVLRSSLLAGNAISLKTEDRMSSQVLGFEYDTRTLGAPGYFVAKPTVETNRTVPARCVPPIDPAKPTRSLAGEWLARYPTLALPPIERDIVGDDWLSNAFEPAEGTERATVEIRAGNPAMRSYVLGKVDKRLGTKLRTGATQPLPQHTPTQDAGFGRIHVPDVDAVIAEAEAIAAADLEPPRPAGPRPGTREHTRQQVHQHLADGVSSPADIAQRVGVSDRHVRDLLAELEQGGQARPVARGRWEVVGG